MTLILIYDAEGAKDVFHETKAEAARPLIYLFFCLFNKFIIVLSEKS